MKTPFIALAFVVAATAATAQLSAAVAPTAPEPPTAPPDAHRSNHELLHADRERVKAD